jgi:hypothetical protein
MFRLIILTVFFCMAATAQTRKPVANTATTPAADTASVIKDSIDEREAEIRAQRKFAVYSKKVQTKKKTRLRLCIQLVNDDTVLTHCVNDSLCRDPETSKVLFQKIDGDTTYVLVLVDAFSKPADKPACDAGHETKLYFARWNPESNKAIWRVRTISSCMKGITNMTHEPIVNWDQNSPLILNYHRGGISFVELKFDPAQYKSGLQIVSDTGKDSED